ncbi:glycoside hydrolase family 99-like domain-containing protein [Asaia bogorensis]|uniref:glycoside hydrolase family 99-like domain-containing protein n=1 Tax=Asaia bogorensis TaxID=91915 RepID=UPI001F08D72E|nr:glycoside hydrolase family 99-like domain-containing protein [Asaia bogorensis]
MPTILKMIGHSGLFDTAFYLSRNPDLRDIGSGALLHYHATGWREGRKPNAFFDPAWYLMTNRDVTEDPLIHYLTKGEYEGRRPVAWFDPVWYRQANLVPANTNALAHYLANRQSLHVRPMPEFDTAFYLRTYPDVAASGMDPVEHYMVQGYREVRRPFEGFDPAFYRMRYLRHQPDTNPFLHWLAHRHENGVFPCLPEHETTIAREVRRRTQPGPQFETHHPLPDAAIRRARVLAYYLPQFHPNADNDTWWGKGFTEWTNISRALPRFADHYQPRIPRDLGHYRLDNEAPLREQAKIARESGIEGFVFYHYWFSGKRLLDTPMETLLRCPDIDIPFCLMWANESWSRRWDGGDKDVLISQDYCEHDDDAMIADLARHMADPRYIRIDNRPLFMIYRPGIIPDASRRIAKWRNLFTESHGVTPIVIMAQAFDDHDPRQFGLDGAIEFPPHKLTLDCTPIESGLQILDEDMTARVYDYAELVDKALADPEPDFPRIRTVSPSWDNDPRRQGAGLVLHGSSPRLYERWLGETIRQAHAAPFFNEPIVCVNAWNEWAEGAYLEPDVHFGAAYLNATARAVTGFHSCFSPHRLLLVGHDAFPAGAQMLLLAIGETLRCNHGIEITFILLGGGDLLGRYRQVGTVEILKPNTPAGRERLQTLRNEGFTAALVNSAASSWLASDLTSAGINFTLLVHELPGMIRQHALEAPLATARLVARSVIVPGAQLTRLCPEAIILPQGLYHPVVFSDSDRRRVRLAYGIGSNDLVVIGVGYGDIRKGFDLFLQLWQMIRSPAFQPTNAPVAGIPDPGAHGAKAPGSSRSIHFMWVGAIDESLTRALASDIEAAQATHFFHLPGRVEDVGPFLAAADLFTLTSREDPYPSVVLEALASGLSCMAFARNGMIPDLLDELRQEGDNAHAVIAPGDLPATAGWILSSPAISKAALSERKQRGKSLGERFSFDRYVQQLLTLAVPDLPTISVVVLSYNYAQYLAARLATIFAQNYPVIEIIVIDDASSDGSAELAEKTASSFNRTIRLVRQTRQSGSVFNQWQLAAQLAQGEWLWIAEADDLCEPEFLSELAAVVGQTPQLTMAFCDSRSIDRDGVSISPDYKGYYHRYVGHDFDRDLLMDGEHFVRHCLSSCNLILNVSAALFRRSAFEVAMANCRADLDNFRLAGDWRLYIELLLQPGAQIAYLAKPLNIHRRHARSVTGALDLTEHLDEIETMHDLIGRKLGPGKALAARQAQYSAELRAQFGLRTPARKKRLRLS